MSKPDVPAHILDEASELLYAVDAMPSDGNIHSLAHAILSAEKRGEERERDACAALSERMGAGRQSQSERAKSAKQPKVSRDFESMAMSAFDLAAAIRKRGA